MDNFPGYDGLGSAVLRRFVTGQSDARERRLVEAWAAETADRRRYLAVMRQLYEQGPVEDRAEASAMWSRIAERMDPPARDEAVATPYVAPWEEPVVRVDVRRRPPRVLTGAFAPRTRWSTVAAVAAGLVLAAGGGALVVRDRMHGTATVPAVAMRQIATGKGQRSEFQLSDGSRVVLGVDSRLRFPATFGANSRELVLDGTAYFEVVHDATRPFLVHTGNAVVQDIGTRFVVTAYPDRRSTQVVVSEGAVALAASRPTASRATASVSPARAVLRAGQLGRLDDSASVPVVRAVDPGPFGAWMRGELVLRDTPLADVAAELTRWFDGEVRLGDPSLASVPVTASFNGESFREAIGVIATIAPVRAVWRGRTVTLYRRS